MTSFERLMRRVSPEPNTGCWLWTAAVHSSGHVTYGSFRLRTGENAWRSHRASWELHRGPIPAGLCVLHRCDNGLCVNPSHLFLGTVKENHEDMVSKGRRVVRRRLTREQIRQMCRLALARSMTRAEIGALFGTSALCVSHLVHGRWRLPDVEDLLPPRRSA